MKQTLFFRPALTMLVTAFALHAQAQTSSIKLTLDKAIEIALSDNPTIRVAEQDVELKKVSATEAWQNLLPTADLTGTMSYTIKAAEMNIGGNKFKMGKDGASTWSGALNVSVPLFAPAVYRTMNMTKTDIDLAVEKSRQSRNDLTNQVTKAYYQLLLAQDSYNVLQQSYAFSEENYNVVNARFTQGTVSEYDNISAEVQMRSLKPTVVQARNGVEISKVQLKVLLGIQNPDLDVQLDDSLMRYETTVNPADVLQNQSLDNNSTLRQLDLNDKMLQHTIKVQRAAFLPTLALNYNYQYQSISNDNFKIWHYDWAPGSTLAVTLSVPLYHASNYTKLKTTRIQQQQLANTRANTMRQLDMQLQSYRNNMMASAEQMESNKTSVSQAVKGRDIAKKRYEVGRGTILELNSSEVALTQAKLAYNQAIYDFVSARSDFDYVVGKDVK